MQVLEHGIDLDGHVAGVQQGARLERRRTRVYRHDEIDVLGSERGAGLDLRLDVARQVLEWPRVNLQTQLRKIGPGRTWVRTDGRDFAYLDAAQLHLRAVLHDQAGPVADECAANGFPHRSG